MPRYPYSRSSFSFGPGPLSTAMKALIGVNVGMFLLLLFLPGEAIDLLGLVPALVIRKLWIWQLGTYMFLHGSVSHVLFNMLALWMFGSDIERVWGPRRFLTYYFVCVISAAVAQLLVAEMAGGTPYPTIGASGGVYGVLLAFGMMFPRRMVVLLFPPIRMPAWLLVTLYGVLELLLGVTGTQAGVAHFAHLGGMAGGFLLIQYWRGRLPIKPGRR